LIRVTKLNGEPFYVNPYEIELIEETPDTVVSLKSGKKILVTEDAVTVIKQMIGFFRLTNQKPGPDLFEQLYKKHAPAKKNKPK
jgi:flagellar protein FlbD